MLFAEKDSLLTHLVSHKYEKSYLSTLLHFELRVLRCFNLLSVFFLYGLFEFLGNQKKALKGIFLLFAKEKTLQYRSNNLF